MPAVERGASGSAPAEDGLGVFGGSGLWGFRVSGFRVFLGLSFIFYF